MHILIKSRFLYFLILAAAISNLSFISPNWPSYIHKRIIKTALKDKVTKEELKMIIRAGKHIDAFKNQSLAASYMHYMRGTDVSYEDGKNYALGFIDEKHIQYIYENDSMDAIYRLGQGIHTLTDSLSPSHEGCKEWNGVKPGFKRWVGALVHLTRELNLFRKDEDKVQQCVANTRLYYETSLKKRQAAINQNKLDTVDILLSTDTASAKEEEEKQYYPTATLPGNKKVKVLPLAKANPVQYTFNAPLKEVRTSVLNNFREYKKRYRNMKLIVREDSTVNLKLEEIFDQPGNENDFYLFSYDNIGKSHTYYSKKGRLPYYAYFQVHLVPVNAKQTKVEIFTINPHVKVGKSALVFLPHLINVEKVVPVPVTTVEEYEILTKIGKALKEKNMPKLLLPREDSKKKTER